MDGKIDYASSTGGVSRPQDAGIVLACCSLVFPALPIFGFIFQEGAIFIFGGMGTFVGLIISIVGLVGNSVKSSKSPGAALWAPAIVTNGIASLYFFWLFAIRGLC